MAAGVEPRLGRASGAARGRGDSLCLQPAGAGRHCAGGGGGGADRFVHEGQSALWRPPSCRGPGPNGAGFCSRVGHRVR